MHNAVSVFHRILVPLLFFCSCFGPFDPYNPPPDRQGDGGTSEPTTNPGFPSGMVAWWTCNDSVNNSLADTLGKNNGQITGCTRDSGISGWALDFNGSGDYVSIPSSSDSPFNFGEGDFTISLWIKPRIDTRITDTTRFDIISKGVAKEEGYTVSITRNGFSAFVGRYSTASIDTSFPASAGVWRHLAVIRKRGTVELFVDNTMVQTYTGESNVSTNLNLLLGRDASGSGRQDRFYSGLIDEIKIFNTAWGAADVNGEYKRFHN